MKGTEPVVHLWKAWGLQVLVLLSFTLQVALLVVAELRRRIDSGVLRAFVWLAYLLADSTAIYILGHLSFTSRSPEHELVAFWAPFLLLHLGGQDNITAYAMEDNQLWLRHLQTLAVQVAAAAYVLYESSAVGGGDSDSYSRTSLLFPATVLMFAVGVLKYGERVWALRCAGSTPSGSNYWNCDKKNSDTFEFDPGFAASSGGRDMESLVLIAHRMLDVPRELLYGSLPYVPSYQGPDLREEEVYKVIEMQLSLMHSVFYTKAEVMHSWCGVCVRVLSLLAIAVSLLLFNLRLADHRRDGYSSTDAAITYLLLVGALVLEIMSLLRVIFSSWTYPLLLKWGASSSSSSKVGVQERNGCNYLLCRVVVWLRRLVHAASWGRSWSASMGQHNLLKLCASSRASRCSKTARWMGVEDPWNTLVYTWSIPVSASMEKVLVKQVLKSEHTSELIPDHINNSRGRAALKRWGLYESLEWSVHPGRMTSEESILIWHIATDIYLSWYRQEQAKAAAGQLQDDDDDDARRRRRADLANAVQELSNYMVFLLAGHSYMLSHEVNRNTYVKLCYGLTGLGCSSAEDLAGLLRRYGDHLNGAGPEVEFPFTTAVENRRHAVRDNETLRRGSLLAARLIAQEEELSRSLPAVDILDMAAQVWVEMLCYAGIRCNASSHAKQLSKGGELITIATLLVNYMRKNILKDRTPRPIDGASII